MLSLLNGRNVKNVGIEIVGFCNAECTFCPAGATGAMAKTKFMQPSIFEGILDDFLTKKIILEGDLIGLFHTSEAFLHPNIDEIFDILEKRNLKAYISSNFMRYPKLDKKRYKTIGAVIFSLSSFKGERYRDVYGGDINKTLQNFNEFLLEIRNENSDVDFQVNWIRYRYNIDEEEEAKKYFCNERGLKLNFVNAIFLDIEHYVDILEKQELALLDIANEKMFLNEQLKIMKYIRNIDVSFLICEEFFNVVIDVDGNWIVCCRATNRKSQNILGSFRDVGVDAIRSRTTRKNNICRFCSSHYLPDSAYLVESAIKVDVLLEKININKEMNYSIYGVGHLAQIVYAFLNKNGVIVANFIDDYKYGTIFDIGVISLEFFAKSDLKKPLVIIIAATNTQTIKKLRDRISLFPSLQNIEIISI